MNEYDLRRWLVVCLNKLRYEPWAMPRNWRKIRARWRHEYRLTSVALYG